MHEIDTDSPPDTIRRTNVVLTLAHRHRRWSDIKTTLVQNNIARVGVFINEYHHHV